jgi:hypothetical protein
MLRRRNHESAVRRWKEHDQRIIDDPQKASVDGFRRRKEKRRILFVQLGFRPLQIALWFSLLVYVFSTIGAVLAYWQQVHLLGWLAMPALLVFAWSTQFTYARNQFFSNAIVTAFTLLIDYNHLIADDYRLVGTLGRIMVVVFGLIIYTKMKDPIFSKLHDSV